MGLGLEYGLAALLVLLVLSLGQITRSFGLHFFQEKSYALFLGLILGALLYTLNTSTHLSSNSSLLLLLLLLDRIHNTPKVLKT